MPNINTASVDTDSTNCALVPAGWGEIETNVTCNKVTAAAPLANPVIGDDFSWNWPGTEQQAAESTQTDSHVEESPLVPCSDPVQQTETAAVPVSNGLEHVVDTSVPVVEPAEAPVQQRREARTPREPRAPREPKQQSEQRQPNEQKQKTEQKQPQPQKQQKQPKQRNHDQSSKSPVAGRIADLCEKVVIELREAGFKAWADICTSGAAGSIFATNEHHCVVQMDNITGTLLHLDDAFRDQNKREFQANLIELIACEVRSAMVEQVETVKLNAFSLVAEQYFMHLLGNVAEIEAILPALVGSAAGWVRVGAIEDVIYSMNFVNVHMPMENTRMIRATPRPGVLYTSEKTPFISLNLPVLPSINLFALVRPYQLQAEPLCPSVPPSNDRLIEEVVKKLQYIYDENFNVMHLGWAVKFGVLYNKSLRKAPDQISQHG